MAEYYIEAGYIDPAYFERQIDSGTIAVTSAFSPVFTVDIADDTGYFIPDYIQVDYIAAPVTDAVANIAASAAVVATVGVQKTFTVAISSTSTIAIAGSRIRSDSADITSQATVTATVFRTQDFAAAISASNTLALTAVRIRNYASDLTGSATATAVIGVKKPFAAVVTTAFACDPTVSVITDTTVSLNTLVTQTVVIGKLEEISLAPAFVASLTLLAGQLETGTASLSTQITIVARPITFVPRPTLRPLTSTHDNLFYSTSGPYAGTYSGLGGTTNQWRVEFTTNSEITFPDNTDEYVLEFFYLTNQTNRNDSVFVLDQDANTNVNNSNLYVSINRGTIYVDASDSSGTNTSIANISGADPADSIWHHFLLLWEPSTGFKVYIDGSLEASQSSFTLKQIPSDPRLSFGSFDDGILDQRFHWFDELRIIKGSNAISEAGYNFSSSSQTVPTGAFTGTSNTQLLLHLENNSNDDATNYVKPPETFIGASALSSAFVLEANAGVTLDATILQASSCTLSADVEVFRDLSSTQNAIFSQTTSVARLRSTDTASSAELTLAATAVRIKQLSTAMSTQAAAAIEPVKTASTGAAIDSNTLLTAVGYRTQETVLTAFTDAAVTAAPVVTRSGSSDLAVTASASTTATRIKPLAASMSAEFSTTASAESNRLFFSDQTAVSSVSAAASRTRDTGSDHTVVFTQAVTANNLGVIEAVLAGVTETTADLQRIRITDAQVSVTAVSSATATRIQPGSAAVTTVSTILISAVKTAVTGSTPAAESVSTAVVTRIRSFESVQSMTATVTATGNRQGVIELTAFTNASITAVPEITRSTPADLSTVTEATISAVKAVSAESQADSVVTATTAPVKTVGAQAVFSGAFSPVLTASVTRRGLVDVTVTSELTATPRVTRLFDSAAVAESTLVITAGKLVSAEVTIDSAMTFASSIRDLRIETISYKIPGETRLHQITGESRLRLIAGETRIFQINQY